MSCRSRWAVLARLSVLFSASVWTAQDASLEFDVKAAFLFNFTKFVQWPNLDSLPANAPFTICILGDNPFGRALDDLAQGESVSGHKIVVEHRQSDGVKGCQVEYIPDDSSLPPSATEAGSGVLTVGEGGEFLGRGGIIAFIIDARHVRFDINLRAATNAGMKLSSKLLSVARSVER